MADIERFEDLIAWQKARVLTQHIYRITKDIQFSRDRSLVDQIRRASVSIMSNLAEGSERGSPREFHQFLVIARASCAEVRSQLYVALDAGYVQQSQFDELNALANETARIIGGLRSSVARRMNNT